LGYFFKRPVLNYSTLVAGSSTGTSDYAYRWQKPGDEKLTNVPSFIYPVSSERDAFYANSEINILKADNIRLQYINLSYSFMLREKNRLPFNGFLVYVNAANVGIIWRKNGEHLDPDYAGVVPVPKAFTIGVRTNF
jgi:hypothetical protein